MRRPTNRERATHDDRRGQNGIEFNGSNSDPEVAELQISVVNDRSLQAGCHFTDQRAATVDDRSP